MMQQDHATQRGGGNNARGERDGDADADGDGDGDGRGEKRPRVYRSGGEKGPSTPVLAFFFVMYIMCGEANRDKLPKDGGEAGSRIIGWTI